MGHGFTPPRAAIGLAAIAVAWACSAVPAVAAENAAATITSTELSPTTWRYSVTLDDTGTTDLGTFWFAWVPGEDFMPVSPTDIDSPASWAAHITGGHAGDGFAIQWVAGAGAALTPGQSLSFSFDSAATPQQMAGDSTFHPGTSVSTSFVYGGAPFSDAGVEFTVEPAATPVPEPSPMALLSAGALLVGWRATRRRPPIQA